MFKFITTRLSLAVTVSSLAGAMLMAPQTASAGNTVSKGGGVKCYWVLVSSNPATGSYVYTQVCRKGGV